MKSGNKHKSKIAYALRCVSAGWPVFPLHWIQHDDCSCGSETCTNKGKHPLTLHGYKDATTDRDQIRSWWKKWPRANVGIATGSSSGIWVLDVDGAVGRAGLKELETQHGRLPKTVTVRTGRGRHYYFRHGGVPVRNSAGRVGEGIDVRGDRGYVVGAGSVHSSGVTYRYVDGRALGEIEVASAPEWLPDLIATPVANSAENVEAERNVPPVPVAKLDRARAYAGAALCRELDRLAKAPKHQRNNTLNVCAFRLGQFLPHGLLDESAVINGLASAAAQIGLDEGEILRTIKSGLNAGTQNPRRLPFSKSLDRIRLIEPKRTDDELAAELAKLGETDTDNAKRFARRYGETAMYTPGRGWLVYDGKRWRHDDLFRMIELAKDTARLIAAEAQHLDQDAAGHARSKFAERSLSKGGLDRMLDLAKSLLAVEDKQLDADFWLLNVENGTIDLRTGRREKHDPRDLLTKIAPVRADRHARCKLFKKFLKRITADDISLQRFIQKAAGLSLTGITAEQLLLFVYGKGKNGKSTLVNLLRDMLGDYGCHTPTETLLAKQYDNSIPVDLARLAGARMVTAIEANFNRHLDEAKIKAMTGGEPIVARFMRQNLFSFAPEFKLWIVANDRPRVRGTDHAFWERMRVIPLVVEIPLSERDKDLPTKLRAEWPGILAWAVRGCLRCQREGLDQPSAVLSATKDWQHEMDHLKRFVTEELIIAPGLKIPSSQMYGRYTQWCAGHGEEALPIKDFNPQLLDSLDVTHKRQNGRSWFRGARFRD